MILDNKKTPNILWICTDQQRYDTIHALGNEYINTPNLDRLCSEGTAFLRAYCQNPVCTPSRASFLTGMYPSSIHVNRNGNSEFPDNVELITKKLADIGYECGLSGKLHLASAANGVEKRVRDGYKVFNYSHSPWASIGKGNNYTDWLEKMGVEFDIIFNKIEIKGNDLNNDFIYSGYSNSITQDHHQTKWCVDMAVQFIEEHVEKPWLFSLNIFDPHPPFDAPKEFSERYSINELPSPSFNENDLVTQEKLKNIFHQTANNFKVPDEETMKNKASYYGMVEQIDYQLGRLFSVLEETGQSENTVVIFMSDHGEMLGDHGLTLKGCRFYEGAVKVPLIISWPGHFQKGVKCDQLIELTDIAPTLAELNGIELDKANGKSLISILTGENKVKKHREFVRCEYYDSLIPRDMSVNEKNHVPAYATMYYDGRYKLIVYHGHNFGELYDHSNDPNEFNNLWDNLNYSDTKNKLIKKSFDESILICDQGFPNIAYF